MINRVLTTVLIWACLGLSAAESWSPVARLVPLEGNYRLKGRWMVKRGLGLRFRSKNTSQQVEVSLKPGSITIVDWTGTPGTRQQHYQQFVDNLPPGNDPLLDIVVKVRQEQWWVFLNNRPVVALQQPFNLPATMDVRTSDLLSDTPMQFQKITPFAFAAEFMDREDGTDGLQGWKKAGGTWRLHTVQQDALQQHTSQKLETRPVVATHSPNFYSLEAFGKGQLLAGYPFEDNYRIKASLHTGPAASGLVFYYQDDRNYYTFGLEPMQPDDVKGYLTLVRHSSGHSPSTATLAVVEVDLTSGQWVMPEVQIHHRNLVCYLDNREVINLVEDMPVGGRYGLYVDGPDDSKALARFDDVSVSSVKALPLPDLRAVRFHTVDAENDIYEQESSILQFLKGGNRNPMDQAWIDSSISGKARWIAIGDPEHDAHAFSADFNVRSKVFDIGLLIGFKERDKTHYRFRCEFNGDRLRSFCEEVSPTGTRVIEDRSVPYSLKQLGTRHSLKAVTLPGNIMKLYYNDNLVYVHGVKHAGGASGVFLGPSTQARISNFDYTFEPRLTYTNKYEKNPVFVSDPFMKHWSSPEGEWFTNPKTKETWHKSDFFDEYSLTMPWVTGSEIHLSVLEGKSVGPAVVKVATDGTLQLYIRDELATSIALPKPVLDNNAVKAGTKAAYTVHYGGQVIWVTSDNTLVGVHHLKYSLKGTRVRVKGFTPQHLAVTRSDRQNIYDALFTQALHDWTIGGGQWQVINRFECKPTFSHLNGENGDGPAFLWSKQTFKGDFCMEFFVGLRHGDWYKKSGRDFNLTIMNDKASPASGYTVTCSGWEPNEMQRLTRLYKNGELIETSDIYTAPQLRVGNRRKLFDPIIKRGRDVHGAWYYIKLRRRNGVLEYYFDNEKIFSYKDPDPISVGSMGIWTYRNSMMVSRVKVSADSVQPAWFPIISRTNVPPRAEPEPAVLPSMEIRANAMPLDIMRPEFWNVNLHESQAIATWKAGAGVDDPSVQVKNIYGGGSMMLAPDLPLIPLHRLAGIRFSVKQTAGARFNFHYALRKEANRQLPPDKQYIYHLSGRPESTPVWTVAGTTEMQDVSAAQFEEPGNWTDVVVWFPTDIPNPHEYSLDILGFGNLNPSYVQQGLRGNQPGARYAVTDIALIYAGVPRLTYATEDKPAVRFRGMLGNQFSAVVSDLEETTATLASRQRPGLNACGVMLKDQDVLKQAAKLYWNYVPADADLTVSWHPDKPYAIQLVNPTHRPGVSLTDMAVGQHTMRVTPHTADSWLGFVPVMTIGNDTTLTVNYTLGGVRKAATLDFSAAPSPLYPVLKSLDGPVALLVDADVKAVGSEREATESYKTGSGRYVTFKNNDYGKRLMTPFLQPFNLSQYPIMSFRYNCDSAAAISLHFKHADAKFAESANTTAQKLRHARAITDGQWHSWLGILGDLQFNRPFQRNALTLPYIKFGSVYKIDQTGRHAELNLDNVVIGPVAQRVDQLTFKPTFACPTGVKLVEYTVISGKQSYYDMTDDIRKSLRWIGLENGKPFTPANDALKHAVGRVVFRGVSSKGIISQAYEVPFMLDQTPPKVTPAFIKENYPGSNGQFLKLTFDTITGGLVDSGAPLDVSKLKMAVNKEPLNLTPRAGRIQHKGSQDVVLVDWPYLLRKKLNAREKGLTLTVSGIVDGAGNTTPDLNLPVTPMPGDTVGPAWISMDARKAPALAQGFIYPWTDAKADEPKFIGSRATRVTYTTAFGRAPYMEIRGYKNNVYAWTQVTQKQWDIEAHPYLSLAVRLTRGASDENLMIQLSTRGGGQIRTPLIIPETAENTPANQWQYVTINVRDVIKKRLKKKLRSTTTQDPGIWQLAIVGTKTSINLRVDIRDLVVHGPWTNKDVLSLESYDASGISHYKYRIMRGAHMIQAGRLDGNTVKPGDYNTVAKPGDWLHLVAVDWNENHSTAVRLPLGGSTDLSNTAE